MKKLLLLIASAIALLCHGQPTGINDTFPFNKQLIEKSKGAANAITKRVPRILDFFASGCMLCFKSLPKIKAYQEQFTGRLQFILIGLEDATIRDTYRRFEEKWKLPFPVVYDSVLPRNLGITYYPHYIWVDGNNVIRAITGPDEVNPANIEKLLNGETIITLQHKQPVIFDPSSLLLDNGNGGDSSSLLYRSLLSEWKQPQPVYLPPSIYVTGDASKFQVLGTNFIGLYNYAYHGYGRWGATDSLYGFVFPGVIIEAGDTLEGIKQAVELNYCYSLKTANSSFDFGALQETMRNDLENYFGYEAFELTRLMPYWSLRLGNEELVARLRTSGGIPNVNITAGSIKLKNVLISQLISLLYARNQLQPPFIDETGIDYNIDLNLDTVLFDVYDVQEKLRKVGIELVKDFRPMKVVLLKPKKRLVLQSGR